MSGGSFSVDRELCRGSGLCQVMGPALFGRTESGYPAADSGELRDEGSVALADEVADCCPTGAIAVYRDDGDASPR
ncbi:(4Fe-4S)-binding protein [Streptomyces cocklensis]|jgi:ferredoxin|uniref:Ferredoxin-1 n=1 Tax=Actinacidiphila cocklensis TaxID=887465 RepID=A0A9W4GQ00_9ACTN|nr:ferredoxin [Actinacidiphila cocklensis]MDD1063725.1 (4Fe-4S)-binding protein [Actinacidiphila cocklensis]WSX72920.1 (4Fe-4S)-binding protein [Streptomyces sp. NBC_00899]WSX81012.1 (4Fe-4S)-binding protein [Streptomyces sp. NBC_00899]CAG6391059.1 putative Ferredoxin-1 [Actinacidiphila cocklensis]